MTDRTMVLVSERIESEQATSRENLANSFAKDLASLYSDILAKSPSKRVANETSLTPLQQLFLHENVRMPLTPISVEEFHRKRGIHLATAEYLVEVGLVTPVIVVRNPRDWEGCHHLSRILQSAYCSSERYQTFLGLLSPNLNLAEEKEKHLELLNHYRSAVNEDFCYCGPGSDHIESDEVISSAYRLTWLKVRHPNLYENLYDRLTTNVVGGFEALYHTYNLLLAHEQIGLGSPLVWDEQPPGLTLNIVRRTGQEVVSNTLNETTHNVAAVVAGKRTWPVPTTTRFLSPADERRIVDQLIELKSEENLKLRERTRSALKKHCQSIASGEADQSNPKTIDRDLADVCDQIEHSCGRLNRTGPVFMSLSGVALGQILGASESIKMVMATTGLVVEPAIKPWLQKLLIEANKRRFGTLGELAQVVREIKQL